MASRPGGRRADRRRANLSSTDFFGIPLQLQTTGGSQPKTLTWNYNTAVNTAAVFQALGALENYQTDTVANTLGALVTGGANGVTINTPNGPMNGVVRIIAPSSTNQPATGSSTPYPNIGSYGDLYPEQPDLGEHYGPERTVRTSGSFQNYRYDRRHLERNEDDNGTLYPAGELVLAGQVTNPERRWPLP